MVSGEQLSKAIPVYSSALPLSEFDWFLYRGAIFMRDYLIHCSALFGLLLTIVRCMAIQSKSVSLWVARATRSCKVNAFAVPTLCCPFVSVWKPSLPPCLSVSRYRSLTGSLIEWYSSNTTWPLAAVLNASGNALTVTNKTWTGTSTHLWSP